MVFGVDFIFLLTTNPLTPHKKCKNEDIHFEPEYLNNKKSFNRTVRPVCRSDQKRIYGVARNELAKILCQVDAYPPPTLFKWSFNNTAETIDMPQSGFENHSKTSSRLVYTPVKVCILDTNQCCVDVFSINICTLYTVYSICHFACILQFDQRK